MLARQFRRVFLGGGNALSVDTDTLRRAINFTIARFRAYTGSIPRRLSLYGTTKDIVQHGTHGLRRLYNDNAGLDLVYWGVESGSNKVLKIVCKGDSKARILEAAEMLRSTRVQTSVMIMPGLGGVRLSGSHIKDTAEVLSAINPHYVTFLGINAPGSAYADWMQKEGAAGINRPLTRMEMAEQMIEIIAAMRPDYYPNTIKIGCFGDDVDKVGNNPLPFGSTTLRNRDDQNDVVRQLRRLLKERFH